MTRNEQKRQDPLLDTIIYITSLKLCQVLFLDTYFFQIGFLENRRPATFSGTPYRYLLNYLVVSRDNHEIDI